MTLTTGYFYVLRRYFVGTLYQSPYIVVITPLFYFNSGISGRHLHM
jgi:hypothetical protein